MNVSIALRRAEGEGSSAISARAFDAWKGARYITTSSFAAISPRSGFLSPQRRSQLLIAQTPDEALELLDEAAAAATQGMVW